MDINTVAMEVILNASNGRNLIDEAMSFILNDDFKKAKELLVEADKHILKAHVAQTKIIQGQASGENMEYSLLFIHAQDTIMTSNSELRVIKSLLPIFEKYSRELNLLREGEKNE